MAHGTMAHGTPQSESERKGPHRIPLKPILNCHALNAWLQDFSLEPRQPGEVPSDVADVVKTAMMYSRRARHDVTVEMDESVFAEDPINAATLPGWWEECGSKAGKLQQVACACYPSRWLQLQVIGISGANVESNAMSN
eukprot:165793-Chlamydomonas_euryale.AAC.1